MSLQYERLENPSQSGEPDESGERPDFYFMQVTRRPGLRWPRAIGIVQIVVGMLISVFGVLEVLIVPLAENHQATLQFNKSTCYGAGIYAGIMMVLTGSTAIRASVSKRATTVYRFYNLTLLTLLLYTALTLFLIIAYSKGWTAKHAYPVNSHMYQIHMFVTIFVVLGLMFALTAVVQYYDVVCCGEMKMWQGWAHCLCAPCLGKGHSRQPSEISILSAPPALLV